MQDTEWEWLLKGNTVFNPSAKVSLQIRPSEAFTLPPARYIKTFRDGNGGSSPLGFKDSLKYMLPALGRATSISWKACRLADVKGLNLKCPQNLNQE